VVGGSVAALVAADAASRRGREVLLLVPGGRMGGGFLPLQRDGRSLDLGPRIIELGYDGPIPVPPALGTYVPGPHGHRPFLGLVDDLIRGLVGDSLQPISRPEIIRHGTRALDWILGGDLIDLPRLLSDEERDQVAGETAEIVERLGPDGLLSDAEALQETTLEKASVGMHGPTFHRTLLGPLTDKALPGGGSRVIADLRRKVWMPLLWPRSIMEACLGTLTYRPDRPMHTVEGGGMGAVVGRLRDRLNAAAGVELRTVGRLEGIDRERGRVRLRFDGEPPVTATDVVLAAGAEEAFRLAGWTGHLERVPGAFVWVDVSEDAITDRASVLFVIDREIPVFRVSENTGDHQPRRRTLVCELPGSVAAADAPQTALDAIAKLGSIEPGAVPEVVNVLVGPSLVTPSFDNRARHADGLAVLRQADLPVDSVGVDAFGADSFNEQVVQGLAAAERWS
jgi:hypothetical protein